MCCREISPPSIIDLMRLLRSATFFSTVNDSSSDVTRTIWSFSADIVGSGELESGYEESSGAAGLLLLLLTLAVARVMTEEVE